MIYKLDKMLVFQEEGFRYGSIETGGAAWVFKSMPRLCVDFEEKDIWFESECGVEVDLMQGIPTVSQLFELTIVL